MKKILIIYATNSGGTYTAGTMIRDVLARKHTVEIKKAADAQPDDLKNYDLIILGSPTWIAEGRDGKMQETMQEFLDRSKGKIPNGLLFTVFGCGDVNFMHYCQAVDDIIEIVTAGGGKLAHESLKLNDFFANLDKDSADTKAWAENLLKKI